MKCLNCEEVVSENFCTNCGQKTSTKRFELGRRQFKHFTKEFLTLNKGLFYSLKELVINPGISIRGYIDGKRTKHLNPIALIFVLLALYLYLYDYSGIKISDIMTKSNADNIPNFDAVIKDIYENTVMKNLRTMTLFGIPLNAILTLLIFKKANHYFGEHIVINAFATAGGIVISALFAILVLFVSDLQVYGVLMTLQTILAISYSIYFYYKYFKPYYGKWKLLFKASLITVLNLIILGLISYIVMIVIVVYKIITGDLVVG